MLDTTGKSPRGHVLRGKSQVGSMMVTALIVILKNLPLDADSDFNEGNLGAMVDKILKTRQLIQNAAVLVLS